VLTEDGDNLQTVTLDTELNTNRVSYYGLGRGIIQSERNGGIKNYSNGFSVESIFSRERIEHRVDSLSFYILRSSEISRASTGKDNITINYSSGDINQTYTFEWSYSESYNASSVVSPAAITGTKEAVRESDVLIMFTPPQKNFFFNNIHCGLTKAIHNLSFSIDISGYTKINDTLSVSNYEALSIQDDTAMLKETNLFDYIGSQVLSMMEDDVIDTVYQSFQYSVILDSLHFKPYDIKSALLGV